MVTLVDAFFSFWIRHFPDMAMASGILMLGVIAGIFVTYGSYLAFRRFWN